LVKTINRNKKSLCAKLKDEEDLTLVKKLFNKADVMIHNFRPGVMEKIGLSYTEAAAINPRIVYGDISGYGKQGPWKDKPGQDLLLQALTGLAYTSGNNDQNPMPFGLAIADTLCGAQMVQGILGALIRRQKTGKGALIELSMMETLLDFQFELLTTYHTSGQQPRRSGVNNGHPLLSAPYGLYKTADGYIAIAMVGLQQLAEAIGCSGLTSFQQEETFAKRDEIKQVLGSFLLQQPSSHWIDKMHDHDIWAMEVMNWHQLAKHDAYKVLQMEQPIETNDGKRLYTTRCPIRINNEKLFCNKPAPQLGEHNQKILEQVINA